MGKLARFFSVLSNILIGTGLLFLGLSFLGALAFLRGEVPGNYEEDKPHLAVLNVKGPILQSEDLLRKIRKLRENVSCKGVLLRIDSPGGAAGASQEIFVSLTSLDSLKPLVVSMGNTAASGGYYIALGGRRIFANPATLTGSIGVIAQFPNAEGLFDKVGLSMDVVKSGKFKDAGSPFKPLTDDDKTYFQEVIDDTHHQFLTHVKNRRNLEDSAAVSLADGRVFTGSMALKAGLVDSLGNYMEALNYLNSLTDLGDDPKVVNPEAQPPWMERMQSMLLGSFPDLRDYFATGLFFSWPVAKGM